MSDERRGILLGIGAYLSWGLFPLYWPLLKPAVAIEILSHRIVWSFVFVAVLLLVRRRWAWIGALRGDRRRLTLLVVASLVIAVNWGIYIWAVNAGYVVESALGYFINPLVTVVLAVVLLHEHLRRVQWVAVGLASVAVLVLTVGTGRPPWIGLTLALSFATYGLAKKKVDMPAVESLAVETAILTLPALVLLLAYNNSGSGAFGHGSTSVTLLLALSGVVTAIPLLMFGAAAPLIPLSTMGLLQYLTPCMQFLIGLTVFHESMSAVRWAGFILVWCALAVFSIDQLHHARARRPTPALAPLAPSDADWSVDEPVHPAKGQ